MPIKVGIVDDKSENRHSLVSKLTFFNESEITVNAANGKAFLDAMRELPTNRLPQVVLMDIEMPVMDGIAAVTIAKEVYPSVHFLMLTVFDDEERIFEAIKAGASGYLLKDENIHFIRQAIREAAENGGSLMSPSIARKAMAMLSQSSAPTAAKPNSPNEFDLSPREMDVLRMLTDGLEYQEIGEKLFISPHTVRNQIARIYEKLHVCNKISAVKIALKKKWFG